MYANTQQKYRPISLNEYIYADSELKQLVESYVYGVQTRPLILFGPYGTGKSLLADLIPKAIDGDDVKVNKIRATDLNNAKEVERHFKRSKQFDNLFTANAHYNYHIIEEVNFDPKAKGAFRTAVEDVEGVDLVIITTNEVIKIDPAILSRSNAVEVKPLTPDQFIERAMEIIAAEKAEADRNAVLDMLSAVYQHNADNRAYYKAIDDLLLAA